MTGTKKTKRDESHVPISMTPPKDDLRDRVVEYCRRHAPVEFTPKYISSKLRGATHEAVKKAIQREMNDPRSRLVKVRRGWYRHAHSKETFSEVADAKRLGLHGIQVLGVCPSDDTRSLLYQNAPMKIKHEGIYSFEFNGRPVTIKVYRKSKTVIAWLKATKNPLEFDEFNQWVYWLFGWAAGKIPDTVWQVSEIGWNVDFVNMDMTKSGFNAITLQTFRNVWFRMYQKRKDLLRWEAHMTPKDASLQDVQRLFQWMIDTARGESEYQGKAQDGTDYSYR